jgi:hypothetical protein
MSQKIFKYNEPQTYGFVSMSAITVNEKVVIGQASNGKDILANVTEILEQRPERGTYTNEKSRRIWQKILVN